MFIFKFIEFVMNLTIFSGLAIGVMIESLIQQLK